MILLRHFFGRRFFLTSSVTLNRNHYEILGLKMDCSPKDIRNAFVQLSKEHHPDMKKSKYEESSRDFIQVNEAYQVLSKPHSRANYDLSLKGIDTVNYIKRDTVYEPWRVDPMSYSEKGPIYSPYYGIRGMRKMSNYKIVIFCILFCAFGAMIQGFAIFGSSAMYRRQENDRKSAVYSSNYEAARERAEKNGNAEQIKRMQLTLKKSLYDVDEK